MGPDAVHAYKKLSAVGLKKVYGRRFKMRSVGLVEAETFFGVASQNFLEITKTRDLEHESANKKFFWLKILHLP